MTLGKRLLLTMGILISGALLASLMAIPATAQVQKCHEEVATIVGTEGKDILRGTPEADVVVGLGGGDHIRAGGGEDHVCAGGGRDLVRGGKDVRGGLGGQFLSGVPIGPRPSDQENGYLP